MRARGRGEESVGRVGYTRKVIEDLVPALLDKPVSAITDGDVFAFRNGRDIVGLWPGLVDRIYGVAVDIGSTTVAAHLADLTTGETLASAGVMNSQATPCALAEASTRRNRVTRSGVRATITEPHCFQPVAWPVSASSCR